MPASYISPLRFHALTPAYDALVRWTSAEDAFRAVMIEALGDRSTARILDIGCGTGTLAVMLKESFPTAQLVGVDADQAALDIAARKCNDRGVIVMLRQADARNLPFQSESFTAATASLFFHHLEDDDKRRVLAQLRRMVGRGGSVVIADWHRAHSVRRRMAFMAVRLLDGLSVTRSHAQGQFPKLLEQAGLEIREAVFIDAPLGTIGVWHCT